MSVHFSNFSAKMTFFLPNKLFSKGLKFWVILQKNVKYIFFRVATCAIFRRKVRYVRSIYGVRWSALECVKSALYLVCFHKI